MNLLILGDGAEELAWARALLDGSEHRLVAACPGFKSMPDLPGGQDLDAALAIAGLDGVIVGGDPALRAEGLRRAASTGLPAVVLHPPGPNADPYYQVAMSRQETGAIVVPDLPGRLHPGVATLEKALREPGAAGARSVRYEANVGPAEGRDALTRAFSRVVDVVRALIGEVQTVSATGIPSNEAPTEALTVHLKGETGRHAEIRLTTGPFEPAKLVAVTPDGSSALECDPDFSGPSRLIRRSPRDGESVTEIDPWDGKAAILKALLAASTEIEPSPGLNDGTRAMEITEAVGRGLRKGRTIDLVYEEMTEVGSFKSIMTGLGCILLFGALLILLVAAAAQGLGFENAVYVAWVIPPALVIFALFQLFRFGIKT